MLPAGPARLCYRLRRHAGRRGERRSLGETDYIRLPDGAHQLLKAPLIVVWDLLTVVLLRLCFEVGSIRHRELRFRAGRDAWSDPVTARFRTRSSVPRSSGPCSRGHMVGPTSASSGRHQHGGTMWLWKCHAPLTYGAKVHHGLVSLSVTVAPPGGG